MTKYLHYGYQSQQSTNIVDEEDDIYSSSMYYNSQNSLLYVVGSTYSRYFDNDSASNGEVEGEKKGGENNHLENSSCFLSIYKLPTEHNGSLVTVNSAEELLHIDESSNNNNVGRESINTPKLIYSKILGTYKNTEVCSNVMQLPRVHDALLNSNNGEGDIKIKLALIGHVQPTPITSEELAELNQDKLDNDSSDSTGGLVEFNIEKKPDNNRSLLLRSSTFDIEQDEVTLKSQQQGEQQQGEQQRRELENIEITNINHGGFLHSTSTKQQQRPITTNGKVYGFVADYDLSISTSTEEVSVAAKEEGDKQGGGVYGALLGGTTLESSPIIYPTSITQNERIPNELYVVSLHSDDTTNEEDEEEVVTR